MSRTSHARHESKQKKPKHKSPQIETIQEEDLFTEHKFTSEILIALVIFGLGLFFMVPAYSALTVNGQFVLLAAFMLVVLVFAITHWRARPKHNTKLPTVERIVFLAVITLLSIAIIVQVFMHSLDSWLIVILVLTILLKMLLTSRYQGK